MSTVSVGGLPVPQVVFTVASSSADGQGWLGRLPGLVHRVVRDWNLSVEAVLDHLGQMSWVAFVEENGTKAVLKSTMPHDDARHEADALDAYGGQGAVRLRNVLRDGSKDDPFVMLLDRCEPGKPLLFHIPDDAVRLNIMAEVMKKLWRQPAPGAPFERLADRATCPWRQNPGITDAALVHRAVEVTDWLLAQPPDDALCHGDLHPENILLSGTTWVAIDPKPLVGDRAFDLAQWLGNYCRALVGVQQGDKIGGEIAAFSALAGVDKARAAGWGVREEGGLEGGGGRPRPAQGVRCLYGFRTLTRLSSTGSDQIGAAHARGCT